MIFQYKKHQNILKYFILSALLLQSIFPSYAQDKDTTILLAKDTVNRRLKIVAGCETAFIITSFTAFNYMWYKDYEKSSFHFFNDGKEWLGMDKLGHSFSGYWLSNVNSKAFQWTGLNHKKSTIIGGATSFIYMATIEVLDGYSKEWGASVWDLTANTAGISLYVVQELILKKQVILLKYSYYPSQYAKYRSNVLGKDLPEKMLKDYNATTFWLSFNLNTLVSHKIPPWLNLAVGYGATGMTGGYENYFSQEYNYKPITDSERAHEYYLSLDLDLTKIKVRSKFVKGLLFAFNCIKIPAPTIEYSKNKCRFLFR